MSKKFAFIKIRSNHSIIEQIIRILKATFPEYELAILDVKKILKKNMHIVLINLFHMLRLYGVRAVLQSKSAFYNRFFGTPYMYHQIRRLLNLSARENYLFSIQDCSLFNGKLSGIPHFVYTDHTVLANKNYPEYNQKRDLLSDSWMQLEKDIYRDANMVFTRSKIVMRSVIDDYECDSGRVRCIYYSPFMNSARAAPGQEKYSSKNILFVGLEWERKGGPLLVRAYEKVLKEIPDASLTIVGCSPKISLPNVKIIGPVTPNELETYYEKAAVFCLPTRREPFGIVFLEAMSYSLPVVGTHIGALPEFIIDGENGYLIDIDDEQALVKHLAELLTHSERCRRMGENGYGIYRRQFTLEAVSTLLRRSIMPHIQA